MGLAEIAGRSRQEACKLIDRISSARRTVDPEAVLARHAPPLANPSNALQVLREIAPTRFFAGVQTPSIAGLRVPGHADRVIASADNAMQGRFDLLGYRSLSFGEPIDWHLDPVWLRRGPRVHWTEIDPLDPSVVGDSKIVWELNRQQWVARLAAAYALTADRRYAERALASIDSWIDANPYGVGVNWSSSLEASYRVMSWAWTLMLLRDCDALTPERLTRVLSSLWTHANYVARYLSYYFSPNTHLTGEALGLLYAGTLFPEFKEARRWRGLATRVLVAEARSQICADGVHFERSTCYHRYTVETYQQFLLLAGRNGLDVPAEIGNHVRRMIEFALSIRKPDGLLPEIGDADGGRLLPLADREQCDPRGIFAVGAAMFGRADFAWAAEGMTADVAWLMGDEGVRRFEAVMPAQPAAPVSRLFPAGGYVAMRSSWDRNAHQMVVDVGPLGCSFSCGHGHADLLGIQCSAFGEPVLVDAGTYCYTAETEWRNFFRGTAAHSTVMIDGRNQAEPDGPFSWRGRPQVHLREWRSNDECDFVDASHTSYDGVCHRRRVMFVKPHYWIVVDDVTFTETEKRGSDPHRVEENGANARKIELGFQFAPMPVSVVRDRWARADTPGGNTFWLGSFAPSSVKPVVQSGQLSPIRGWVSADYGQRTPAPQLVYSAVTSGPWRSISLLIPMRGERSAVPTVSVLFDDHDLPIGLQRDEDGGSIFVDEADIFTN